MHSLSALVQVCRMTVGRCGAARGAGSALYTWRGQYSRTAAQTAPCEAHVGEGG
jgi:hypothetical protein